MPPFMDNVQLHRAVHNQAMPVVAAVAANASLRDRELGRFERDDPPPYVESTDEELDDAPIQSPPHQHPKWGELWETPPDPRLPEELLSIMDEPIRPGELQGYDLASALNPGEAYFADAHLEDNRVARCRNGRMMREKFWEAGSEPLTRRDRFRTGPYEQLGGDQRPGVLVRHNVKYRWEQLGLWDPTWGYPGRGTHTNDQDSAWKWPWQQQDVDKSRSEDSYTHQLLARVLHLRKNLRRGESFPALPRSHPHKDTSVFEAESFLISRPWFIFQVELAEEKARYARLSIEDRRRYPYSPREQVITWWKERGDWRDEYDRWSDHAGRNPGRVSSWKWRHESLSPGPEDVESILHRMEDPEGDDTDIGLTPSEMDEWEVSKLPHSERPTGAWECKGTSRERIFPGQAPDYEAIRAREQAERARCAPPPRPVSPQSQPAPSPRPFFATVLPTGLGLFGGPSLFEPAPPPPASPPPDLPLFALASPSLAPARFGPPQSPPFRSPPPPYRLPSNHVSANQVQTEDDAPPPRRSARVANFKRRAEEPDVDPTPPSKRLRTRQVHKATTPPSRRPTHTTGRANAGPVKVPPEHQGPTPRNNAKSKPKKSVDDAQPKAGLTRSKRAARADAEVPTEAGPVKACLERWAPSKRTSRNSNSLFLVDTTQRKPRATRGRRTARADAEVPPAVPRRRMRAR